jgi:hypothetical protein
MVKEEKAIPHREAAGVTTALDPQHIDKAIGAHGAWKLRLKDAIQTGKSPLNAATVAVDNACEFGKWLYSIPAAERDSPWGKRVVDLHALFHQTAAKVLALALAGHTQAAMTELESGGSFTLTSKNLTSAMVSWKSTLSS